MLFWRFVRACRKYNFTYVLSTYGSMELILRPNDTFENHTIHVDPGMYQELFTMAISEMKRYRKEKGWHCYGHLFG